VENPRPAATLVKACGGRRRAGGARPARRRGCRTRSVEPSVEQRRTRRLVGSTRRSGPALLIRLGRISTPSGSLIVEPFATLCLNTHIGIEQRQVAASTLAELGNNRPDLLERVLLECDFVATVRRAIAKAGRSQPVLDRSLASSPQRRIGSKRNEFGLATTRQCSPGTCPP